MGLYYKTFQDVLSPYFLRAYNSISANSKPEDALRAPIIVIPKQDKDYTKCGNYWPIALLNADLKLFKKILANRLMPHFPYLVHADFIPQRGQE